MKIQCSCGSKFVIEVTPEMARQPVHFVCATCGRDSSEYVNSLVRQELGIAAGPAAFGACIAPPPPGATLVGAGNGRAVAPQAIAISGAPTAAAPPPASMGAVPVAPPVPTVAIPRPAAPAFAIAPPPGVAVAPAPAAAPSVAAPRPAIRIVSHAPAAAAPAPAPVAVAAAPPPPTAMPGTRVKIAREAAPAAAEAAPSESGGPQRCPKHPGQFSVEKCVVCSKPLCPQCMALFGYVCSPLCKNKAETNGIHVPVYALQRDVKEARAWRKVVLITMGSLTGIGGIIGLWFWFAWFGSTPKPMFTVRFENDAALSGGSAFAGQDQIVFIHGGVLARHDMKQKKELWSHYLVDTNKIAEEVEKEMRETKKAIDDANNRNPDHVPRMPDPRKLTKEYTRSAERSMELKLMGSNIWIIRPDSLTRYDWSNGERVKEIPIKTRYGIRRLNRGDEILFLEEDEETQKKIVTRINLDTCESKTEDIMAPKNQVAGGDGPGKPKDPRMAGLPTTPGKDMDKPLDPKKVAQQAQRLPLPGRIALPATLGNTINQNRSLQEMDDDSGAGKRGPWGKKKQPDFYFTLVPTKDGFVQFASKMVEQKIVTHQAMKPPTKPPGSKSALEGNVSVANQYEVANEMLNEMQRERGGGVVEEDQSRYQVKLKKPDGSDEWTGEVIGFPSVFPLQTVTVVTGNKMLIVLDKSNKKMWQGELTYAVEGAWRDPDDEDPRYGQGPCVERKDVLYVFDAGVLTAFDLANGTVKWRLPSVGISGLHFDDEGYIYANTTDAGPESIKYSRQIDITAHVGSVVVKIDPKTGKTLWRANPGGLVTYVSGKFIYAVQSYSPYGDDDEESPYTVTTGFETKPYLRIRRINPKNGKEMWEHFQERGPLDVQFDKNKIRLVFRKEVQVLKFISM